MKKALIMIIAISLLSCNTSNGNIMAVKNHPMEFDHVIVLSSELLHNYTVAVKNNKSYLIRHSELDCRVLEIIPLVEQDLATWKEQS